uniref:Uncharacterized protein n=1 Tax=Taeniopygia guttata TaxID=59729 RepID=A0A674GC21_TAEGU
MLVDCPRDAYTPAPEGDDRPPSCQTKPESPTPVRPRHAQCLCAILLLGLVAGGQADPGHYPHQPFRWVMQHLSSDKVFKEVTTANTPSFVFNIADLFPGQPKLRPTNPHIILMYISYWCPASNPGKRYCDYPGWGHCGYWGCETIVTDARLWGDRWQLQEPDKFLQFTWAPFGCGDHNAQPRQRGCVSYNMTVLQPDHPSWATGRTWTVVLREPRRWVNVRIIRLQPPNVLRRKNTTHPKTLPPKVTDTPTGLADTLRIGRTAESDPNQIFRMLEATFLTLNETKPNLTNSCWLCYDVKPPFYEGIALDTPFNYSTASAPHQCRWDTPRRGITLSQITGQGRCFGNAALAKQKGNFLSPCVFLAKFNDSIDFCVQVLIVPRVLYHSDEEIYHLLEEPNRLHKREIITGITIAMLLGLGAAGTATGVSAIATQQHGLSQLHMTIDEDLQRIEKSISYLEKSVSSLSEVVLQNRQGLDLLFMQQGGLCAALKEEFSMAELRDRLAQRKRDRETQQSWFESWFNQSHWLTSLISALVGPLAILLLAVTIGPWLLNKVVSFVQARTLQPPSDVANSLKTI